MPAITQAHRLMAVATPLGPDALLLERLAGVEAVSELYEYRLDLLAEVGTPVPFDRLLGRPAVVTLDSRAGSGRCVTGLVSRFAEGAEVRTARGDGFVRYQATLVPPLWLLTRRRQSRIFQHQSVPDILKAVFAGLDIRWKLAGQYEPRDYCVQYRETDFAFASRLLEEEGIFYFFDHADGRHALVVGDFPGAHPPVPGPAEVRFDPVRGGTRPDDRVTGWAKSQEVRTGRHTLRDHCFELPDDPLESVGEVHGSVRVGAVEHPLAAGGVALEAYDYPGGYAGRFDGIDPGGGDRAADVGKVIPDGRRTVKLRAEAEAARGLRVDGASTCRQFVAGCRFALAGHGRGDGEYLLVRVEHAASLASEYGTDGDADAPEYTNTFIALPAGLPFRPARTTPRPVVAGAQTATVVGPPGEEIFTDKYGRVKVQFPWDRAGRMDAGSSCWVRVSQGHAGKKFGGIDIPRVGQEVVVAFEEGDPDRPIAIGRVYNAARMPPFDLPGKRMMSGLKSNTYPGGGGNNEISMDDSKGKERMFIHAQYDQDEVVEHDQTSKVGNNRTADVAVDETVTVGNNRSATVQVDHTEIVGSNHTQTVGANHAQTVGADHTQTVGANQAVTVAANQAVTVGASQALTVGMNLAETVGLTRTLSVGMTDTVSVGLVQTVTAGLTITITAGVTLTLAAPGGTIVISPSGIEISGKKVVIQGETVHINP